MGDKEISTSEFEAAAGHLKNQGLPVTAEALMEALAPASASAIQRHLVAWRIAQEKSIQVPKIDIHGPVVDAIETWVQHLLEAERSGHASRLLQIEADLAPILESSERIEAANQGLTTELADTSAELDRLRQILAERESSIERLTVELRHVRDIASDAVVSKAKDQLAIEGKDMQIAELRQQVERQTAAISAASDARLAAEMELVGASTARDTFAAEIQALRAELDARRAELRR